LQHRKLGGGNGGLDKDKNFFFSDRQAHSPNESNEPAPFAKLVSYLPVPLSCTICMPNAHLMFKFAVPAPVGCGCERHRDGAAHPALRLVPQLDFAL